MSSGLPRLQPCQISALDVGNDFVGDSAVNVQFLGHGLRSFRGSEVQLLLHLCHVANAGSQAERVAEVASATFLGAPVLAAGTKTAGSALAAREGGALRNGPRRRPHKAREGLSSVRAKTALLWALAHESTIPGISKGGPEPGRRWDQNENKKPGRFVPLRAIFVPWNFLRRFVIGSENHPTH
jgi:hypothetical protein